MVSVLFLLIFRDIIISPHLKIIHSYLFVFEVVCSVKYFEILIVCAEPSYVIVTEVMQSSLIK